MDPQKHLNTLLIGILSIFFLISSDKAEDIDEPIDNNPTAIETGTFKDARDYKTYN